MVIAAPALSVCTTAGVTVSTVLSDRLLPACTAVIVVVPVATLVASPLLPPALLIVAAPVADELQVTAVVRSCVELSL